MKPLPYAPPPVVAQASLAALAAQASLDSEGSDGSLGARTPRRSAQHRFSTPGCIEAAYVSPHPHAVQPVVRDALMRARTPDLLGESSGRLLLGEGSSGRLLATPRGSNSGAAGGLLGRTSLPGTPRSGSPAPGMGVPPLQHHRPSDPGEAGHSPRTIRDRLPLLPQHGEFGPPRPMQRFQSLALSRAGRASLPGSGANSRSASPAPARAEPPVTGLNALQVMGGAPLTPRN